MSPRRNKTGSKNSDLTLANYQVVPRVVKPQPVNRKITIGKTSAMIPYVDRIEDLVSMETHNSPIVINRSPKRSTIFISKILKQTGIETLAEIGDAIAGKH